ncbi:MAG: SRPBCC domain-containing protein [Microbacteriaceae bacterium]
MSDRATIKGHTIIRTVRIDSTPERVWDALTDPAQLGQWFGDTATMSKLAVGGTGEFDWKGYGTFPYEITEVEPCRSFAYRWSGEPASELRTDDSTIVRFTIEHDGEATVLTVTESGFDAIAGGLAHRRNRLDQNREGWNIELDELLELLGSSSPSTRAE